MNYDRVQSLKDMAIKDPQQAMLLSEFFLMKGKIIQAEYDAISEVAFPIIVEEPQVI